MKETVTSLLIIFTLLACRPTTVLQSGKSQNQAVGDIKKVLVIAYPGVLKDREIFERAAVKAFSCGKKDVVSLNEILGDEDNSFKSDPKKLTDFLLSNQVDAVIEVRFVSIRKEQSSSEEQYPTRREYRIMDDVNYTKYIQEYEKREEKGAIFDNMKVKMDVKLLMKVEDNFRVVWSARTESSNPKGNQQIAKGCSKKAASAMKKQHIY
ncbi:MAG TPA: hypothetical protein DCX54_07670 [Flavobacteriales bacterium]|nr:hypothetical protein [Flavobacteriales bacterium]